jgi:LacI family transcriptional regulator
MHRGTREGAATIPDVARQAGVSTATAARALGGYGSVSTATQERVLAAAAALGYRTNGLARSMVTGTTHTLGVVLADIENPYFYRALRGITDTARSRGYGMVLTNTDEDADVEREALVTLVERRVDGLIVCPAEGGDRDRSHLTDAIRSGLPVVLLDRHVPGLGVDMVGLDNRRAAADATRLLIQHGHTRIAIVTGARDPVLPPLTQRNVPSMQRSALTTPARAAGYRDAMAAAGLELRPEYLSASGFHRDDALAATEVLMNLPQPPTAILAFDSVLSLGVLLALRRLGKHCPDEVSVIGFDDAEWAEVVSPPLSVVRQPVYEIGSKACTLLLDRIEGKTSRPSQHRLKGQLVERESIAAPSASVAEALTASAL